MTSDAFACRDVDDLCAIVYVAVRCLRDLVAHYHGAPSARGVISIMVPADDDVINLPGWRWATIMQFALDGSSCSLHTEVSKAHGGSFGVVHSKISVCGN